MTEHDALKVLLVRSIETQGGFGNQLQDADKQMATRMAIEQVGKDAAPDAFIAARATALIGQLAPKEPLIEAILAVRLWRSAWIWASVAVGLVLGVGTSELFGEDDRQNIVDLLPWLVILWNLAVYVALIAGKHMPLRPGFIERLARWANPWSLAAMTGKRHGSPAFLFHPRLRPLIRRIRSSTELAAVLRDFGRAWTSACLPMVTARTALGWSQLMAPLPAWVSATGIPVAAARDRSDSEAPAYTTPPPATISGRFAARMTATARSSAARSGTGRPTCHTRRSKKATGQSSPRR